MQNLSCLVENIHQYSSICRHKMYPTSFFFLCTLGAAEANISRNLQLLIWNLIELIPHQSGALITQDLINIACSLLENQISIRVGDITKELKDKTVWAWQWAVRTSLSGKNYCWLIRVTVRYLPARIHHTGVRYLVLTLGVNNTIPLTPTVTQILL